MENSRLRQNGLISVLVCFLLFLQIASGFVPQAQASGGNASTLARQSLQKASDLFLGKVANTDDSNAIIRYLIHQPASTSYIQAVQSEVKSNQGNYSSYNALAKRIVGWTAAGQDATHVAGINLVQKLGDLPTDSEGRWNNELIWGLIALDSKGYSVPADAVGSRQSLINGLVQSQVNTGGWDLVIRHNGEWAKPTSYDANYQPNGYGTATTLDIDITGMALTALAPYQTDSSVSDAVYHAVEQLKTATPANSDSISQMIIGLSAVGIDPADFSGQNLVQQLLSYQLSDGMFKYDDSSWGSGPNNYATNDALTALAAYLKFTETNADSPIYYHMSGFYGDPLQQGTSSFLNLVAETDDSNAIIRFLTGQTASNPYIQSVQSEVQANQGAYSSYNALAKKIMGWTAAGQDATNVSGVNLVQKLGTLPTDTEGRWNNELIWGLMALDSKGYSLSSNAVVSRQALIDNILQSKLSSGGWDLVIRHESEWKKPTSYDRNYMPNGYGTPTTLDIDITGMALTALAPYQNDQTVSGAVYDAMEALKSVTPTNSDSLSQMIIGLSAVGTDPSNFNGQNLVQQLLSYQLGDGMFKYDDSNWGSSANSYATNDALTALIAYQKFAENRTASPIYYHMSGVALSGSNSGNTSSQQPQTPQTGTITFSVTGDSQHGTIFPATEEQLQNGDTAFSVLVRTLGGSRIKYKSYSGSLYVQSIDGISEFDHGPLSGWVFYVDGKQSQISASDYHLNSGSRLEWRYTGETNSEQKSQTSTALDSAAQSLALTLDNQKPIQQVAKTAVVLNPDQRMDDQAVQQLIKTIKENEVNVQQKVEPASGATISDSVQKVTLHIPEQALKQTTDITVKELSSENRKEVLSPIYEFTPKGQTFDKPIEISIKAPLNVKDLNQVALVWLNEQTNEWVPIPAVVDAKTGIVTGRVNHFTKFAVIDRGALNSAINIDQAVESTVKKVLNVDSLSDWSAFALARAGQSIPASYLANVKAALDHNQGSFRNVTDFERMVLGVLAAGGDPLNVNGYNMIEKIYNNKRLTSQGTNGVIFGLIALDSKNYPVPDDALWNRDKMVDWLLKNQNQDGGWSLVAGDASDLDITSMTLASLAPYQNREDVKKATDSAVQWIVADSQQPVSYSESIAQEIQGLAALGINPADSKFNRSGMDLVNTLLQFQQADGGFTHQLGQDTNPIATEQALAALDAYQYYVKGQGTIYQFASKPVEVKTTSGEIQYADADKISTWALESVQKASKYKLMQGMSSTVPTFAPQQPVTRAQFTAVMLRLLGKTSTEGNDTIFDDVQPTDWYYNDVRTAKELGIIHGVSDTTFAPNAQITREQMAVIIANAYQLKSNGNTVHFADESEISPYALSAVQALNNQGLMVGYDAKFDPQAQATREMVAALAVKLYEKNQK